MSTPEVALCLNPAALQGNAVETFGPSRPGSTGQAVDGDDEVAGDHQGAGGVEDVRSVARQLHAGHAVVVRAEQQVDGVVALRRRGKYQARSPAATGACRSSVTSMSDCVADGPTDVPAGSTPPSSCMRVTLPAAGAGR